MTRSRWWLLATFLVLVIIVGVPFWRIPYSQVNLPDALLTPALLAVAAGAVLLRVKAMGTRQSAFLAAGAAVPAAVVLRVIVETVADPTSHNLWPFEVVIASVLGLVAAGAGVLVARLVPQRR